MKLTMNDRSTSVSNGKTWVSKKVAQITNYTINKIHRWAVYNVVYNINSEGGYIYVHYATGN